MDQDHIHFVVDPETANSAESMPLSLSAADASRTDDDSGENYPLVRFLFALPSPLPVPNGWALGTEPGKGFPPDCPMAFLTFWQEQYHLDTLSFEHDATMRVLDRLALGEGSSGEDEQEQDQEQVQNQEPAPPDEPLSPGSDPMLRTVTVVDAITRWDLRNEDPSGWDGEPENLEPKHDPIIRCMALARQVSRAFRLVDGRYIDLISYERMPIALTLFHAEGRVDRERLYIPPRESWHAGLIMTLNHWNIPPDAADVSSSPEHFDAAAHWMRSMRAGVPARSREILMEARIAMRELGEYGEAVVKANTGCEVLLDSFLSAMLWEEHLSDETSPDAVECGEVFAEGRVKVRINTQLAPRLKGDWTSPRSPIVRWLAGPHALRHRVVHGGYEPTRQEASDAINAVDELSLFLFDRLAAQRNKYKRVALMLLGVDGLARRNLLRGEIERFRVNVADTEPPWIEAWGMWHQVLVVSAAKAR